MASNMINVLKSVRHLTSTTIKQAGNDFILFCYRQHSRKTETKKCMIIIINIISEYTAKKWIDTLSNIGRR